MNSKSFETLFCMDKKGKSKQWQISVSDMGTYSEITTTYGGVNYRKIETTSQVTQGKNLNKSNSTTHFEQAIKEAQSRWTKKKDIEGYQTKSVFGSIDPDTIKLPMLAQDFKKHESKVKFPCYVQPKLDGYRMLFNSTTKSMTSRQGKPFDVMKNAHMYSELIKLNDNIIFDGELYIHGGTFEHLGLLRKKKLTKGDLQKLNEIEYHVYDIIDEKLNFKQRSEKLKGLLDNTTKIKFVQTIEIDNVDQINEHHTNFTKDGYEGTIIRNSEGKYKCKFRSTDLLKYKDFEDSEYPIVDFTFEIDTTGKSENLVVWVCKANQNTFKVRPKGTKEERKELYKRCQKNFEEFKGRNLWVSYFELTDRGVPRFPSTSRNTYSEYIRDIIQ